MMMRSKRLKRRYSTTGLLMLVVAMFSGQALATQGEFPIDTCLTRTDPALCVNFVDDEGRHWFLAEIGFVHPDLGELPLPLGTEFRVTGTYCVDCVHPFCGTFDGFIFGAALIPCVDGDVNADGEVNFADVLDVIGDWGPCGTPPDAVCPSDQTGDGEVNFADLLAVLGQWS